MKSALNLHREFTSLNDDMLQSMVSLERQTAMLKKVIRIMAGSMALDEEGRTELQLSPEEAEFIKKICDEEQVFLTGGL